MPNNHIYFVAPEDALVNVIVEPEQLLSLLKLNEGLGKGITTKFLESESLHPFPFVTISLVVTEMGELPLFVNILPVFCVEALPPEL